MAKSAAKTKETAETVGQMIDIKYLEPSPTNPRKRFPDASIEELAGSIREQGVIEPLIVRLNYQSTEDDRRAAFEIVCGERRYRASIVAGLDKLPCIVRELTDEQVLDMQIHENLHREDVHPMDEAYGYQFLKEKLGCDVNEVALRVGKSEGYVLNRLKLNQLIPEVQKDIEDGFLNLSLGLEIAKYAPDAQYKIYNEIYENREWNLETQSYHVTETTDKTYLNFSTPGAIAKFASNEILHLLADAPFDKKATNLRKDGLACVNCPSRTGANASLFSDQIGKKDSCLDPSCFGGKKAAFITLTRERLAHEASVAVEEVIIVDTSDYRDTEHHLGYNSFIQIVEKQASWRQSEKKCEKSATAIDTSRHAFGAILKVCLTSSGCQTHFPGQQASSGTISASTSAQEREAELDKKRQRKDELFDVQVGDLVRNRVFRQASEKFAAKFSIADAGTDFLPQLIAKIWGSSNNGKDSQTLVNVVKPIMREITDSPKGFSWGSYDDSTALNGIRKESDTNQKLMLFLFVHGNKGMMNYGGYASQKAVKTLAAEYDIDYRLIDAKVRVEIAPKKHVETFKLYLAAVEAGDAKAKIPRIYSENYRPKD